MREHNRAQEQPHAVSPFSTSARYASSLNAGSRRARTSAVVTSEAIMIPSNGWQCSRPLK